MKKISLTYENLFILRLWVIILLVSVLLGSSMILLQAYTVVYAAVDLRYFTSISKDGSVELRWETSTEVDTTGFFIQRSLAQNGTYSRISDIIWSEGDPLVGAQYVYIDDDVDNGVTYWYRLEILDIAQQSEFTNPISSTPGVGVNSPTLTATVSATSINTPTRTSEPTLSNTAAQFGTATSVSTLPGSAAGELVTLTPEVITPTATLIPLPAITLEFPAVALGVENPENEPAPQLAEVAVVPAEESWFTLERIILIGFILLLWVLLIGWYLYAMDQVKSKVDTDS